MIHTCIKLETVFEGLRGSEATLTTYVIDNSPEIDSNRKRASVVICPGGGYGYVSDREAEPIVLKFMAAGYNAFVLHYSGAPKRYPQQLLELAAAVAHVRGMADAWHVEADQIAVCGFSAGGHLAGSLGNFWVDPLISETLGIDGEACKPNKQILAYPVISGGEFAHKGSFDNLLGEEASEQLRAQFSLELCVGAHTPPTFLWHTVEDAAVPVENSLLMACALRQKGISFEMHIYPHGCHGLSTCEALSSAPGAPYLIQPHVGTWLELVMAWLEK
ncbi:MAG: alpha/beta hydrolase [Cellulosilyticaceae bacterium]